MRLSTVLKTALSASAAVVLLSACGGSDSEPAASGSSAATTSSSAAEETTEAAGDADAEAFCGEAQAVFADLESAATTVDPSTLPGLLEEAAGQISAIEPPAEISDSWGTLTEAFSGLVAGIQGLDLSTPEGQQAFTQQFTDLTTEASAAQGEVQAYVQANCDISAAPTT